MKRKVLVSLVIVGLSGLAVGGGTMAYFMDIEVSEGNEFVTGAFDAVLEDENGVYGVASNPEVPAFFSVDDAKPSDDYRKPVGLRVDTNDAWACMAIERTADDDISLLEPEMDAGDTDQGAGNGELGASMGLHVWTDMGDGQVSGVCDASPGDEKFQPQCGDNTIVEKKSVHEGGSGLGTVQTELVSMSLSDSGTNAFTGNAGEPLTGTKTYHIGINYSVSEDAGNEIQTDRYESDLKFYTEQYRGNPDFSCEDAIGQEEGDDGTDDGAVCGDGIVQPGEECDDGNDVNDDSCTNSCTKPSSTEVCDGKDNDQDGVTDEGCSCNYQNTQTGVCSSSTIDSTGSCQQPVEYESDETTCDNLDNDCDGIVDEGCITDSDGDGVADKNDCKPSDEEVYPGAQEVCDGKDNNCDGIVDEGCSCNYQNTETGVCSDGTIDSSTGSCSPPAEYESDDTSCDSLDNDCDGMVDENCDLDGDGYGSIQDCDNSDPNTYPGAAEEDSTSACMKDADGDGYGDATPGSGITAGSDCDDSEPSVNPGESEVCDSLDNDCDGSVDENLSCSP